MFHIKRTALVKFIVLQQLFTWEKSIYIYGLHGDLFSNWLQDDHDMWPKQTIAVVRAHIKSSCVTSMTDKTSLFNSRLDDTPIGIKTTEPHVTASKFKPWNYLGENSHKQHAWPWLVRNVLPWPRSQKKARFRSIDGTLSGSFKKPRYRPTQAESSAQHSEFWVF